MARDRSDCGPTPHWASSLSFRGGAGPAWAGGCREACATPSIFGSHAGDTGFSRLRRPARCRRRSGVAGSLSESGKRRDGRGARDFVESRLPGPRAMRRNAVISCWRTAPVVPARHSAFRVRRAALDRSAPVFPERRTPGRFAAVSAIHPSRGRSSQDAIKGPGSLGCGDHRSRRRRKSRNPARESGEPARERGFTLGSSPQAYGTS